jgi:hypothetical protein
MEREVIRRSRSAWCAAALISPSNIDDSICRLFMAKQLGDENAPRAVGRANGTNMICILIPCDRLIHTDGTLCKSMGG